MPALLIGVDRRPLGGNEIIGVESQIGGFDKRVAGGTESRAGNDCGASRHLT